MRVTSIPWTAPLVRVMAGLMLCIFVAAMDSTVVGTALPTISRELNGFSLYSWVFTGYLLTGTTSVPIWGRLADLYGRRRLLLVGLGIYLIVLPILGLHVSANSELIGGNYTNVTSDIGACIAAGGRSP